MLRTAKGDAPKGGFAKQDVEGQVVSGFVVEHTSLFLSSGEFETHYGVKAKALGLKEETILDTNGNSVTGIIVRDESQPWRRLKVFYAMQNFMREMIHAASTQLRPEQAMEALEHQMADSTKSLPKSIAQPSLAPTESDIEAAIAKLRKQEEEEAANAEAMAKAEDTEVADDSKEEEAPKSPGGLLEMDLQAAASEEEEEEEEETPKKMKRTSASGYLGQRLGQHSAAKAKAKGKPKRQSRQQAKRPQQQSPGPSLQRQIADNRDTDMILPEDSASHVEATTRRRKFMALTGSHTNLKSEVGSYVSRNQKMRKTTTDYVASCKKWRDLLDIQSVLEGNLLLNEQYQLRRAATKLEEQDPHDGEVVLAHAHLEGARCAKMMMEGIESMSKQEREKAITQLMEQHDVSKWPPSFQELVLAVVVKEAVQEPS